jgi:hypothetical protein
VPFGIKTTFNCFPISRPYINNCRSQLIQQLLLDLHLCLITLDFPLSNLVSKLPPGSKTVVDFSKKLSPAARNLALTGDPFFAFDNSPMSQPGSLSHLQPPQTTTSHIPSLWTHLWPLLPSSLLWPVTSRRHLRRRFHNHVTLSSRSFVSFNLRLLLGICLIAALRDPHLHLHHVFRTGPRLQVPPLSPTLPPPWARQPTSTGSKTHRSGPTAYSRSKIVFLLLLSALHLGTQPRQPCQPSPRQSRRSCGRNVWTVQHPSPARSTWSGPPSNPQPPMNSSSYQVTRTKFTLYLAPKTFIASVTFHALLAHPTVQLPASSHWPYSLLPNPIFNPNPMYQRITFCCKIK